MNWWKEEEVNGSNTQQEWMMIDYLKSQGTIYLLEEHFPGRCKGLIHVESPTTKKQMFL